ncbi:zinc finger protein 595-like [Sabethes cyaneus]|uniref:zinc finger protein 595-like n=1 Tax=Sabethes cyaneus TaxID=53552 RepID=UPI00237DFF7D|nr:zinc finger protein 595-like [Sabethes cyaneus]
MEGLHNAQANDLDSANVAESIVISYECPEESLIVNENEIIEHEETVQAHEDSSTVYNCDSCGMAFHSIEEHIRQYHRDEEVMIELEEQLPNDQDDFGIAELTDEDSSEESSGFKCRVCKTELLSARSLKLHLKMHDRRKSPAARVKLDNHCNLCNRSFSNREHLQLHILGHGEGFVQLTGINSSAGSGYPCNYCGKRFKRPHEKVKHERIHTGERPYCCDICGKRFRISNCLTIHLRTHEDSRPFVCSYCKKRFKVQSAYNHHLKTHSSERNYRCSLCPKAFKTAVQLNGHKKVHTKPFSCSECSRPFGTLYAVRKHMQEHQQANNKLTYGCDTCGAHYGRISALRDHRKEQHGIEPDDSNVVAAAATHRTDAASEIYENVLLTDVEPEVVEEVMF